jgi:hypothetical protein
MDANEPSIRAFIAAFREEWFTVISGGFSVPFVFLAAFLDNKYAQVIFRERVGTMRIDMERDVGARIFSEKVWEPKFDDLQNEIASKIEEFSSSAEATLYRHRGNLQRPINTNMGGFLNERLVDLCIHDLDYLRLFIQDFSRNKGRSS